jgi:hypothetical protein
VYRFFFLRYVESKIEQANELYESREKSMILDRDKALEKLELAIRVCCII